MLCLKGVYFHVYQFCLYFLLKYFTSSIKLLLFVSGQNANQTSAMTAQNSQAPTNITDPATIKRAFDGLGLPTPHNINQHGQHPMNSMQNDGELILVNN